MVRPELQEAKVKLYEKKDRTRLVILFGVVLFAAFMMIALLNLIDSIQLSFRPVDAAEKLTNTQLALQRFLTWATVGVVGPPPAGGPLPPGEQGGDTGGPGGRAPLLPAGP